MSNFPRFSKFIGTLKYAAWFISASFLVFSIVYFIFSEFSRHSMRAMNCEKYSPGEFDLMTTEILSKPVYLPPHKNSTSPITFQFNLTPFIFEDTILILESSKADSIIYRGPYQDKITIQAGNELLNEKGYDNFTFSVFKKKSHQICRDVYEAGQFWQTKKIVHIDLLPFREINPRTNLPVSFKLWTE